MTRVMRQGMHLTSGTAPRNGKRKRSCTPPWPRVLFLSWLWLLVVYTFWYVFNATSVLCSSRPRRRFPSSLASSAVGCDCGRKTWLPSSLAGCSLAEGRARGSARSPPSQGRAAPWGFSSGESQLLHALPPTRDALTHRASLWHIGWGVTK